MKRKEVAPLENLLVHQSDFTSKFCFDDFSFQSVYFRTFFLGIKLSPII